MGYNKYYKKVKIDRDQIDRNTDVKESVTIDKMIYILLMFALLIIPLFIKAHIFEYVSPKLTFLSTGMQADIFSYYKYIFLIILTILIGILFLYKVIFLQYEITKSKVNLFVGVLAIVVILSAIFSPYKSLALYGMFNRHEGTLAYICYFVLLFVAANMKFSVKQLKGFFYTLYPFVIINMLLGLVLFNEKNLLEIVWIKDTILGSIPKEAQVSEGAQLWATVSNPNYISGIGAVLAILFLTWAIFDRTKIRAAVNVVVSLMSFTMVLTSFSTSGFLTLLILLPIIIILIFFNDQKIKSLIVIVSFMILAAAIYVPMANKNPRVWNETLGFIIKDNPFEKQQVSMEMSNSYVLNNSGSIGNHLDPRNENKKNNFGFVNDLRAVFLPAIAYAEKNDKVNTEIRYEIPTLPTPSSSAGSGRAYIWEKTFETAMKRPILGYGLDTFTYVFPQDDIDKVAGLGTYNVIVDKPHNMYLGLLIGSGIIALLAFILLVGSVLWKGIRTVWKRESSGSEVAMMLSLFTASFAYLVQGMFNDSVIGSAVIFWILLGTLVSVLRDTGIVSSSIKD